MSPDTTRQGILDRLSGLAPGQAVVLGLPLDENSSYLRGPALAPAAIRQVLRSGVGNWCCEQGLDLSQDSRWLDLGDLDLAGLDGEAAFAAVSEAAGRILAAGARPLFLGGDHSVTFPVVRAFSARHPDLNLLHLDAHPDLYEDFEGNPRSHASPFARLLEAGAVRRLVQVGVRTRTPHQRRQAERYGVETIEMRDWSDGRELRFEGPVYVSLDMDAFDPAFAPGVSHHEPGGFSSRQVLEILRRLDCDLVGADLVEFNPIRESLGITAALGAKLYKELVYLLIAGRD